MYSVCVSVCACVCVHVCPSHCSLLLPDCWNAFTINLRLTYAHTHMRSDPSVLDLPVQTCLLGKYQVNTEYINVLSSATALYAHY